MKDKYQKQIDKIIGSLRMCFDTKGKSREVLEEICELRTNLLRDFYKLNTQKRGDYFFILGQIDRLHKDRDRIRSSRSFEKVESGLLESLDFYKKNIKKMYNYTNRDKQSRRTI